MTSSTSAQSICPKASPFAKSDADEDLRAQSDATQHRPTRTEGQRKPTRKALDATYASSAFCFPIYTSRPAGG